MAFAYYSSSALKLYCIIVKDWNSTKMELYNYQIILQINVNANRTVSCWIYSDLCRVIHLQIIENKFSITNIYLIKKLLYIRTKHIIPPIVAEIRVLSYWSGTRLMEGMIQKTLITVNCTYYELFISLLARQNPHFVWIYTQLFITKLVIKISAISLSLTVMNVHVVKNSTRLPSLIHLKMVACFVRPLCDVSNFMYFVLRFNMLMILLYYVVLSRFIKTLYMYTTNCLVSVRLL